MRSLKRPVGSWLGSLSRIVLLRLCAGLWMILGLLAPREALAADVNYLIKQLKSSDDFGVRTQAAIALGATHDPAAVDPLCSAMLNDASDAVRAVCAASVGKLGRPEGMVCLKDRVENEPNSTIKTAIDKAIKDVEKAVNAGYMTDSPRFYVSLGKINNKTSRPSGDIDQIVRSAMAAHLLATSGYAIAPKGESSSTASQVEQDKGMKGLAFQTTIDAFGTNNGLSLTMRVVIISYPGKDIKGEVAPRVSLGGASPGDHASENTLLRAAAENAVDSMARVAAAL